MTDSDEDDSGAFATGMEIAGRYLIKERIGEGGVGHVYRATHKFLRTEVAIKVLRPGAGQLSDQKRFKREAFALSKVAHDNCLAVTDFGEHEGIVFLVTEFLEGSNLGDVLFDDGRLPVPRTAGILVQLLRALGHAHERGVIHRDLKPDNIFLVAKDGNADFVKVLDFGLAKLQGETLDEEGGGDLTETGITFGTPKYMAPEQVTGGSVDGRTDLYAVSVIAYHMVAGRAPFVSDDPHDLLMAHCTKVPPMFSDLDVDDVPTAFEEVIRKGLRKSANDRYETAREYLEAIDQCVHGGALDPAQTHALRRSRREEGATAELRMTRPLPVETAPHPVATPPQRRWIRFAAAAAGIAIISVIAALQGSDETPENETAKITESDSATPERDRGSDDDLELVIDEPELENARKWAKSGQVSRAIDDLRPRVKSGRHQGRAAFLMGTLYFRKMYWSDGFNAYKTAIARDPSYAQHPLVIANSVVALGSRSKPKLAEQFIRRHLGKKALDELDEAARSARHKHHRERAAKLARKLRK